MELKEKLRELIKNQENCIAFTRKQLSHMEDAYNIFNVGRKLQKLIGGLNAYINCYELFNQEPPAANPSVTFGDIKTGEHFKYYGKIFIKTNRRHISGRMISVRLSTGVVWTFKDSHAVTRVNKKEGAGHV